MRNNKQLVAALALSGLIGYAHADEKDELLKLRNTTVNLIKQLVKQKVLTDKMAQDMIEQAEVDAGKQVAEAKAAAKQKPAAAQDTSDSKPVDAAKSAVKEVVPADEVRVAYVPDFVKDEIRQQVRSELREEVVGDVMQKAKNEQWGLPSALPEWTKRFKLSGDLRLREQAEYMASDNAQQASQFSPYYDWTAINNANGNAVVPADAAYLNTLKNRQRIRERFRLGMDVNIAEGLDAGIRLATGDIRNPTSTNQTLGNTGQRYTFNIDRAYLKYDLVNEDKFNWLTVMGGRTPNPFLTAGSELVWDEDLSFEGVAATIRHRFGESGSLGDVGVSGPTVFATAGAFPLQETNLSSRNKWLFGGQAGLDWGFANQDNFKFAAAYFDYSNVKARSIDGTAANTCDLANQDIRFSVPQFMQYGNSLAVICQGAQQNVVSGLVGLASDYKIVNITAAYDTAVFAPHHVKLSADFAKNVGFNNNDILNRYRNVYGAGSVFLPLSAAQNYGWQVRADIGWPKVDVAGNWSVFSLYKHLGSDAVIDAYTDSDLHLGGTNIKGWVVGGNYGLMKNVWLTARWLSGGVITGPRYNLDILQVDLNTRF